MSFLIIDWCVCGQELLAKERAAVLVIDNYFRKRARCLRKQALYLHKRALYLHERAQYLGQKALHLCNKALHLHKRALHLRKRALHLRKRVPYLCNSALYLWPGLRTKEQAVALIPNMREKATTDYSCYRVATISRLLKITGLFCKRAR